MGANCCSCQDELVNSYEQRGDVVLVAQSVDGHVEPLVVQDAGAAAAGLGQDITPGGLVDDDDERNAMVGHTATTVAHEGVEVPTEDIVSRRLIAEGVEDAGVGNPLSAGGNSLSEAVGGLVVLVPLFTGSDPSQRSLRVHYDLTSADAFGTSLRSTAAEDGDWGDVTTSDAATVNRHHQGSPNGNHHKDESVSVLRSAHVDDAAHDVKRRIIVTRRIASWRPIPLATCVPPNCATQKRSPEPSGVLPAAMTMHRGSIFVGLQRGGHPESIVTGVAPAAAAEGKPVYGGVGDTRHQRRTSLGWEGDGSGSSGTASTSTSASLQAAPKGPSAGTCRLRSVAPPPHASDDSSATDRSTAVDPTLEPSLWASSGRHSSATATDRHSSNEGGEDGLLLYA